MPTIPSTIAAGFWEASANGEHVCRDMACNRGRGPSGVKLDLIGTSGVKRYRPRRGAIFGGFFRRPGLDVVRANAAIATVPQISPSSFAGRRAPCGTGRPDRRRSRDFGRMGSGALLPRSSFTS